jgi:predicted O-methyltransferase YrrM
MENQPKFMESFSNIPYIQKANGIIDFYKFCRQNLNYPSHYPGHFYTPVISLDDVQKRQQKIFIKNCILKGIDLNEQKQLALLEEFKKYYAELPFSNSPQQGFRYYYENEYFGHSDAIHLYSVMRHFKPRQIIEVGSGFSSCLMMDVNDHFFNKEISLTFIEPYPERLNTLKRKDDSFNLIQKPIQEVDPEIFKTLRKNDILFIDSTHIVKTGSDVNYILFEILPILHKGVLIHFHDIQYPFEYPIEWVLKFKRSWNENYFLRAFLMHNKAYEIISFDSVIGK